MEKHLEELIAKYNTGLADASELKRIETAIEKGEVELTQLTDFNQFSWQAAKLEVPSPSLEVSNRFYSMLAEENKKKTKIHFLHSFLGFFNAATCYGRCSIIGRFWCWLLGSTTWSIQVGV